MKNDPVLSDDEDDLARKRDLAKNNLKIVQNRSALARSRLQQGKKEIESEEDSDGDQSSCTSTSSISCGSSIQIAEEPREIKGRMNEN